MVRLPRQRQDSEEANRGANEALAFKRRLRRPELRPSIHWGGSDHFSGGSEEGGTSEQAKGEVRELLMKLVKERLSLSCNNSLGWSQVCSQFPLPHDTATYYSALPANRSAVSSKRARYERHIDTQPRLFQKIRLGKCDGG